MARFDPNKSLFTDIIEFAKQTSIINLLESGVDQVFIRPLLDIVQTGISSSSDFTDLLDELKIFIEGDTERLGTLDRYVKQITNDSISQFNANYHQAITQDLGLEFFQYVGGKISLTRDFCSLYDRGFYHRNEVRLLGETNFFDPKTRKPIADSSKVFGNLLEGRIAGTNGSNILTNRGGWNCRHQFLAVRTQAVPKIVIVNAIEKGFFKPKPGDIAFFGLAA